MTKFELVKSVMLHGANENTPYAINLAADATKEYGDRILTDYASKQILDNLQSERIEYSDALSLAMDIYRLKREFGDKLTFWGGISTQQTLPSGTVQQVIDETTHIIQSLSINGGYITSPSQEIQSDVSYENLVALIETAKKYCI